MAVRTPWKTAPRRSSSDLNGEEDRRLATLASEGDEAAFEAIFDRHHRGLLTFCRHMLGSREEAEDVLQHTFAAAYRQLTEQDAPRHMRAWLYATARNRCLSVLRSRRELPDGEVAGGVTWLPEEVERRSDLRDLLDDIQRLPNDQRTALVLAELEDMEHAEVAEVVGCRPDKVRSLVFQARTTLGGWREARALPCREVREEISIARGPELRRAHLRRHLAVCGDCRAFRQDVDDQRRRVALLLPPVPIALALKEGILEGALTGAATAASGGTAAGGAGGAAAGAGGATAGAGGAGGAAAGAGAAATGGGIAAAVKVGAAALVIGGAGVVGYNGLRSDDNTPKPEIEQAAPVPEQPESTASASGSAGSQPTKAKKAKKQNAKREKRLKARQASGQGSSAGSVGESTAAAETASPSLTGTQAPATTQQAPAQPAPAQPAPAPPPAPKPPQPQPGPTTIVPQVPEVDVEAGAEIEATPPAIP